MVSSRCISLQLRSSVANTANGICRLTYLEVCILEETAGEGEEEGDLVLKAYNFIEKHTWISQEGNISTVKNKTVGMVQ